MSNRKDFVDPPLAFRPLQIIHGFDFLQGQGISPEKVVKLLKERGCGGAVVNVGWKGYLDSDGQWALLRRGIGLLGSQGLRIWLYDEEGYPSGTAGGKTLEGHPEYEARGLICTKKEVNAGESVELQIPGYASRWVYATALQFGKKGLITDGALDIACNGCKPVKWTAPEGRWLLLCFCEKPLFEGSHAYCNFYARRRYPNLMTPEAAERFCNLTHRAYGKHLPDDIGKGVEAIFTDEPSLISAYHGAMPGLELPAVVPWERRLPEYFASVKGYPIWQGLPGLFMDIDGCRQFRCDFYNVVARRVAESFFGTIRRCCKELGISSTGHLLAEEFLSTNVLYEGDLMKCLRELDIPGIDMIHADPERILASDMFLVPKMASSVAHMAGRERVMAEHSDYSEREEGFDKHPLSMEQRLCTAGILYALGINTLASYYPWVPVANPMELQSTGKKEALGPEYRRWTDFVGRLGMMLSGGSHVCQVGVLYPIWGAQSCLKPSAAGEPMPRDANPAIRQMEDQLIDTCRALLSKQWDFDLIDDQGLRDAKVSEGKIEIGDESYRVLVVTTSPVMPVGVLEKLLEFERNGGMVLAAGMGPEEAAEPGRQGSFEKLRAELEREGLVRVDSAAQVPSALAERLTPDLSLSPPCPSVISLHRSWKDRDAYLLVNVSGKEIGFKARLSACREEISLWWPDTGRIESAKAIDSATTIALAAYGSVLVVLEGNNKS